MSFHLQTSYVHLSKEGKGECIAGGEAFWSLPPHEMARYERGWLVSEFAFDADWSNWEMHPEADELVYLLSGAIELILERPQGMESVLLEGSGAVLIPRGIWHTAKVRQPSRMLHVTMGAGTVHRPVEQLEA